MPFVSTRSLIAIGRPCSGPGLRPARSAASARSACSRAASATSVTMALTFGLTRSIWLRCASRTSRAVTPRARRRRASSTAPLKQSSDGSSARAPGAPNVEEPLSAAPTSAPPRTSAARRVMPSSASPMARPASAAASGLAEEGQVEAVGIVQGERAAPPGLVLRLLGEAEAGGLRPRRERIDVLDRLEPHPDALALLAVAPLLPVVLRQPELAHARLQHHAPQDVPVGPPLAHHEAEDLGVERDALLEIGNGEARRHGAEAQCLGGVAALAGCRAPSRGLLRGTRRLRPPRRGLACALCGCSLACCHPDPS